MDYTLFSSKHGSFIHGKEVQETEKKKKIRLLIIYFIFIIETTRVSSVIFLKLVGEFCCIQYHNTNINSFCYEQ